MNDFQKRIAKQNEDAEAMRAKIRQVNDEPIECEVCQDTLAIPSDDPDDQDPRDRNGMMPCPICAAKYPHKLVNDECVYCGMAYAGGACPALEHPARQ